MDEAAQVPREPSGLGGGWATAAVRAGFAILVSGALAEGLAFLLYAALGGPKPSKVEFARIGGAIFYAFHRVGFVFEVPRSVAGQLGQSSLPFPISARFTAALALMGGTALAAALLYRGGRAVADEVGRQGWARGFDGAKIGVPYALVCLIAAWGLRFSVPLGQGSLRIHPSYVAAGLWPLGLGVLFGFLGGSRSGGGSAWSSASGEVARRAAAAEGAWIRRVRAAVAGGWWMLALGLLLSFAGLLVLAADKPDATHAYFKSSFNGGADNGAATIAANLLVLPNMAAWVLFPSMGGCLGISGGTFGLQGSFCFLSYTQFPAARAAGGLIGGGGFGALPSPPAGYYAFILAPLISVVAGGMVAARRAQAGSRSEAAALGVLGGMAFGLMALLLLVLSIITVRAGGQVGGVSQAVTVRVGPALAQSLLLALVWGIAGGGVGGLIQGGKRTSTSVGLDLAPPPPPPSGHT